MTEERPKQDDDWIEGKFTRDEWHEILKAFQKHRHDLDFNTHVQFSPKYKGSVTRTLCHIKRITDAPGVRPHPRMEKKPTG